jgi:hypothetical protein
MIKDKHHNLTTARALKTSPAMYRGRASRTFDSQPIYSTRNSKDEVTIVNPGTQQFLKPSIESLEVIVLPQTGLVRLLSTLVRVALTLTTQVVERREEVESWTQYQVVRIRHSFTRARHARHVPAAGSLFSFPFQPGGAGKPEGST